MSTAQGVMRIDWLADKAIKELSHFKLRKHQLGIKRGMAKYLKLLRLTSAESLIEDRTGLPELHDYMYMWLKKKMQAVHPTMLTSRSGRLKRGLLEGGQDEGFTDLTKKLSKTDPSKFKSLTGVIEGGGTRTTKSLPIESFSARWTPMVRDGSAMLEDYRQMFKQKGKGSSGQTLQKAKQMAAIRFRHEFGLKGNSRPFFYPAYLKTRNRLSEFIREAIQREGY